MKKISPFYVYGSVHRWSILIIVQRDAILNSLFFILQVHSTCFGCQPPPSSGVHKTVTTACAGTSFQRGHVGHVVSHINSVCTLSSHFSKTF